MADSINCVCQLSGGNVWHCQWAITDLQGNKEKRIAFTVTPALFVRTIQYLENVLADPGTSVPRPDLDSVSLHFRYRRNAELFELRFHTTDERLKAMVTASQLKELLDYHQLCLQEYAIAIYEGRTPIPAGYPQGYPDPHW